MIELADARIAARLLWAIPRFLRHPMRPAEAHATLARRRASREADFLALVRRAVSGPPASPYRQLLAAARCEPGDVANLVRRDGVESALRALYRAGVYLTVDEFKGRRPAERDGRQILIDPAALRNPAALVHVPSRTGGSRGAGTPVPLDLGAVRDWAVNKSVAHEARGGMRWDHARWSIPGGATIVQLLLYAGFGAVPVRWFSQVDPADPRLDRRYRWSARALRWGSGFAGVHLPEPEHVPLGDAGPVARWMAETLGRGRTPHLATYVSAAVLVCQAAAVLGLDLRGAQFSVGGEPITPSRLDAIRKAGAEAAPRYGSMDAGLIGDGCLAPAAADDHHLYDDLLAFVQPGREHARPGVPPDAVLVSGLRPTAPLLLLNVALGDRATVVERTCGCPLERAGWRTHLTAIRSYEKLTAGGMTFLDTEVVEILETTLPARFGGGPTDYQLVEDEGPAGEPCLRLLVHPGVGPVDSAAVAATFLTALTAGPGAAQVMGLAWREAGLVQVERMPPRATASGKILHLYTRQASGT